MEYGVMVDGEFSKRDLVPINAKGFSGFLWGRDGTYDQYVMNEINRSYGELNVQGKRVLDIGGNIGCFTVWAWDHHANTVVTLEPEPNNHAVLKKNVDGNCGIFVHNAALHPDSDEPAALYLSKTGKNPGNSSMTKRRGRTVSLVNQMSINKLKESYGSFDVAKIDCEGAEYELVKPLLEAFPDLKQVALELHINGFSIKQARELHEYMLSQGFTVKGKEPKFADKVWATLATYVR